MKNKLQFLFLFLILMIPVIIFLVLKGFGTNQFAIPVYYENGIPQEQQFDCNFAAGPYTISWPADLQPETPAAIYVGDVAESRNMVRRIAKNRETATQVYLLDVQENEIDGAVSVTFDKERIQTLLHCTFASDTLNQWILVDGMNRVRGYYNQSLEEQDRLLDEISILLTE